MNHEDFLGLKIGTVGALIFAAGALIVLTDLRLPGALVALLGFGVVFVGFLVHAAKVIERIGRRRR